MSLDSQTLDTARAAALGMQGCRSMDQNYRETGRMFLSVIESHRKLQEREAAFRCALQQISDEDIDNIAGQSASIADGVLARYPEESK